MSRIWRSFSKRTTISPLRYSTLWAIATLSLLFASNVYSQAPHSLSFQGFVTDDGGVPIEEPNVSMTFKLYDQATEIWSETQPSVSIESGIFNVLLGSVTPLDTVRFDRALLVGIKIGADPEMVPRTPLAAAAYAKALPGLYTSYHDDGSNKSYNVVGGGLSHLNELGAWFEELEKLGGTRRLRFRAPEANMQGFQEWLKRATRTAKGTSCRFYRNLH